MAGWSLGLSLAFCVPLGIFVAVGLAITVLVRSRDGRDHGRGLAIAALIISSVRFVIAVVIVLAMGVDMWLNGWDETERDADGRVREAGLVSIDRLQVDDCILQMEVEEELTDDDTITGEAMLVPCEESHRAEVYAVNPFEPAGYVDQQSLDAAALTGCLDPFEEYVGQPYRTSRYELYFYSPAVEGWSELDDTVVCIAAHPAGQQAGTIEGSGQ